MSIKRLLRVLAFGLMLAGLATIIPSRVHAQNSHESSTSLGVWAAMSAPLGSDRSASLIGTSINRATVFPAVPGSRSGAPTSWALRQ